jgi:hypothetical protein
MKRPVKWMIAVVLIVGLVGLAVWGFLLGREEIARERERDAPIKEPPRTARNADGQVVVTLDRPTQERAGLTVEPLSAATLRPEVVAYGTLQEDADASFTLRAPVSGTVRPPAGRRWPTLGEVLPGGGVEVGGVEPRFTPTERVDLASKLAAARADAEATTASLAAAKASYERLKTLGGESQNVSLRDLQQAEAKAKGEEARLRAARETVTLIETATGATAAARGPVPLTVGHGGQVVELAAQPGESVAAGQTLLRVAGLDSVVAAVGVLPDQNPDVPVGPVRVAVIGREDQPVLGQPLGLAPAADARTLGRTFLLRVPSEKLGLRPGMAVAAYLPLPGPEQRGVTVPRPAVVRFGGKAWAYALSGEDKFVRREVAVDRPTAQGWFVTAGWAAGVRAVVTGAQTLLSEELKGQIQIGEEGGAN